MKWVLGWGFALCWVILGVKLSHYFPKTYAAICLSLLGIGLFFYLRPN